MRTTPLAAILALAPLAQAGCDAPPLAKEPPTSMAPLPSPVRSAEGLASSSSSAAPPPAASSSPPPAPPAPRFAQIELAPTQGDLKPLLHDEAARAKAKGLTPLLYFYADWCPPCRTFNARMKDPEIADALEGVYLVKLNLDDWHDKLPGTGFTPRKIPAFYLVTEGGGPTGKMIDGDRWAKATPATIGAALKGLLQPSTPRRP